MILASFVWCCCALCTSAFPLIHLSFRHLVRGSHIVRRPSKRIVKFRSLTTTIGRSSYLALVVVESPSSPSTAPQLHNIAGSPVGACKFLVRTTPDQPLGTGCLPVFTARRRHPGSLTDAIDIMWSDAVRCGAMRIRLLYIFIIHLQCGRCYYNLIIRYYVVRCGPTRCLVPSVMDRSGHGPK